MRDSQRSAVYRWESNLPLAGGSQTYITLDDARALVEDVYGVYSPNRARPRVGPGRGQTRATYSPRDHLIELPKWARQPAVVLHEIAHSLLPSTTGRYPSSAPHGPVFATLLVELLSFWDGVDAKAAKRAGRAQRPRKVKFAPMKDIPQRVVKIRRRKPLTPAVAEIKPKRTRKLSLKERVSKVAKAATQMPRARVEVSEWVDHDGNTTLDYSRVTDGWDLSERTPLRYLKAADIAEVDSLDVWTYRTGFGSEDDPGDYVRVWIVNGEPTTRRPERAVA